MHCSSEKDSTQASSGISEVSCTGEKELDVCALTEPSFVKLDLCTSTSGPLNVAPGATLGSRTSLHHVLLEGELRGVLCVPDSPSTDACGLGST